MLECKQKTVGFLFGSEDYFVVNCIIDSVVNMVTALIIIRKHPLQSCVEERKSKIKYEKCHMNNKKKGNASARGSWELKTLSISGENKSLNNSFCNELLITFYGPHLIRHKGKQTKKREGNNTHSALFIM